MALLGVGSAKIDLIIPKETYHPGEQINGYFLIKGGTIDQQMRRIHSDLVMTDEANGTERVIDSKTILLEKLILADETLKIPFSLLLPRECHASDGATYRFHTKLFFQEGVESSDQDIICVI